MLRCCISRKLQQKTLNISSYVPLFLYLCYHLRQVLHTIFWFSAHAPRLLTKTHATLQAEEKRKPASNPQPHLINLAYSPYVISRSKSPWRSPAAGSGESPISSNIKIDLIHEDATTHTPARQAATTWSF